MPPLPTIAHTVRAAFTWVNPAFTRDAITVMHFNSDDGDLDALFSDLDAAVSDALWQHTTVDSSIATVQLIPLDGTGAGKEYDTGSTADWSGPQPSGQVIPQAAVVAKHTTIFRGRSYRGRSFLPWPAEGVCSNGRYDNTNAAGQQTAWNNFQATLLGGAHEIVIASYKLAVSNDVSFTRVERLLGTQRLRQPRPR